MSLARTLFIALYLSVSCRLSGGQSLPRHGGPYFDPHRCSQENTSLASRGDVGNDVPVCPTMLVSMSQAMRASLDGPLLMEDRSHATASTPCTFKWFTPEETCSMLSHPSSTIVYVGDSLMRHAMHGMQLLVRDDIVLGALREELPANVTELCTCNRQFAVKSCRQWILKDTQNATHQPCPGTRVAFFGADGGEEMDIPSLLDLIVNAERSVVLLGGWGMHNGLDAQDVHKNLIQPIRSNTRLLPHVKLVCVGIHSLQDNVPDQYKDLQNNHAVGVFNRALARKCAGYGIPFFDTFSVTYNTSSFDGIHYGLFVNVLKAQLLLNYLKETESVVATSRAHEEEDLEPMSHSPHFDAEQCSHENASLTSRGIVSEHTPVCREIMVSLSNARRASRDGPLLMADQPATAKQEPAPCTFKWFSPAATCSLLSAPASTIIYIGDSITRHAAHGMQLLLRDDLELGALREDLPANASEECSCHRQFAVRACRQWIIKDTHNVTSPPCPGARVVFMGAANKADVDVNALSVFAAEAARTFVILGGWGFRNSFMAQDVFKNLIQPIRGRFRKLPHVKLICMGIHAFQGNVPEQYQTVHSNPLVISFNRVLARKCALYKLPFFDTFPLTAEATSFDGYHYGLDVNILKAQVLLNFINGLENPGDKSVL